MAELLTAFPKEAAKRPRDYYDAILDGQIWRVRPHEYGRLDDELGERRTRVAIANRARTLGKRVTIRAQKDGSLVVQATLKS